MEACANKLCSVTGFVRIVKESSILDSDKDRIPKEAAYGDNIILDGVKFLTFSEWSKDATEEFVFKFRNELGSEKVIKSITWNCGTGEKTVFEHIYGRKAPDYVILNKRKRVKQYTS